MENIHIIILLFIIIIISVLYDNKHNKSESFTPEKYNKRFELPWYEGKDNTNFTLPINTHPNNIIMESNVGENKIYVNSVGGIKIGDRIQINEGKSNSESHIIAGIGNNILELQSKLRFSHEPNESVHNVSNPNTKYEKNEQNNVTKYYATLNNNDKLQYNQSSDPWGGSSYVETMGGYQYTLSEADKVCKNKGLRLCDISEIIDKNICNAGWTSNKIRGYPMATGIQWYDTKYANPSTRYQAWWCGGRSNGWRTWSNNPSNKGSAHCCKDRNLI